MLWTQDLVASGWSALTTHPALTALGLIVAACVMRREAQDVVAPFFLMIRDGVHAVMMRSVARSRHHVRSISRYRRELDHLTPRSLVEDVVLLGLMAMAFYMAVELSYWLADGPIQSLLDRLGADVKGPIKVVMEQHTVLVGAIITVEVFCGIMLLDLVGGTNVFGIVKSYRREWRIAYAVVMMICFVTLVFIEHAMGEHFVGHLQSAAIEQATGHMWGSPADFLTALKDGAAQTLSRPIAQEILYQVGGAAIAVILAFILFPLDILKDMFPLTTMLALLAISMSISAVSFLLLIAVSAAILLLTLVFRLLVFPMLLIDVARRRCHNKP